LLKPLFHATDKEMGIQYLSKTLLYAADEEKIPSLPKTLPYAEDMKKIDDIQRTMWITHLYHVSSKPQQVHQPSSQHGVWRQ